jgi:hypothetical protein
MSAEQTFSLVGGVPKFQRNSGVMGADLWTAKGMEKPKSILCLPIFSEPLDYGTHGTFSNARALAPLSARRRRV